MKRQLPQDCTSMKRQGCQLPALSCSRDQTSSTSNLTVASLAKDFCPEAPRFSWSCLPPSRLQHSGIQLVFHSWQQFWRRHPKTRQIED